MTGRAGAAALPAVLSFLAALVIAGMIVAALGSDPIPVYRALLLGPFEGRAAVGGVIAKMVPLLLAGLSVGVAFRAGVFNLGAEGQLYLGAFAAAWVGFSFDWPGPALIPAALIFGAAVGALYALIPGILRAYMGANEIVTTIMLNYVAIYFCSYLVTGPFKPPSAGVVASAPIAPQAHLGRLLVPSQAHAGIFIALALTVATYLLLYRTPLGYELRMSGLSPRFAEYGGVNVRRTILSAMLVSGALAGVLGAVEILGVQYRFRPAFSPGYGFDGITVALLARVEPLATPLAALLFAILRSGANVVQIRTTMSREVVDVLQGIIILFVTAEGLWRFVRGRREAQARAVEARAVVE